MQSITCAECHRTAAKNESYRVEGRELCESCTHAAVERRQGVPFPDGALVRLGDPAPCLGCGMDLDGQETRPIGGRLVCLPCDDALRNRPFPNWLKGATVFVLGMVVVSFVYNGRFIRAHMETNAARRALAAGDLNAALVLSSAAARRVPEVPELAEAASYIGAMSELRALAAMLQEDGKEQGVANRIAKMLPTLPLAFQSPARGIAAQAELALAFREKNYDKAVKKADELVRSDSINPRAEAARAMALAAQYAASGDQAVRKKAVESFDRCKRLAGGKLARLEDFEPRFKHRIATLEVITRDEFRHRYPHGWSAQDDRGGKP